MTTPDPRWQRADGGWWHWPDGATAWTWHPDPPVHQQTHLVTIHPTPAGMSKAAAIGRIGFYGGSIGCMAWSAVLVAAFFVAFVAQVLGD